MYRERYGMMEIMKMVMVLGVSNVSMFKRNIRRKIGSVVLDSKGLEVSESLILYKDKVLCSGGILKKLSFIIPNGKDEFVLYEMFESEYAPIKVDVFSKEKMDSIKKRYA